MSDVKPLKKSSVTGLPRQVEAAADRLIAKGIVFEGDTSSVTEKIGGLILDTIPDSSYRPSYLANGEIDYIEIFNGPTQITLNRIARVDLAYDASLNPTVETWNIYDTVDGTTVLRTITVTHTWTGVDLTKSAEVTV